MKIDLNQEDLDIIMPLTRLLNLPPQKVLRLILNNNTVSKMESQNDQQSTSTTAD